MYLCDDVLDFHRARCVSVLVLVRSRSDVTIRTDNDVINNIRKTWLLSLSAGFPGQLDDDSVTNHRHLCPDH